MRVVVIGAGVVGLAIAWRLRTEGHDVTVVDPAPASGATHAAGGMLTPVGEAFHGEDDLTRLLLASARRYRGFVDELAVALPGGTPTGYLDSGTIICGADAADRGTLGDLHDLCLNLGLGSERITTREARRLEPLLGPRISCAFLAADDHQVDPRVLAAAMLRALEKSSVTVVRETASAVEAGEPASVRLGPERIEAAVVVVATGHRAGGLDGDVGVDLCGLVRPVFGDVARLVAPPHLAPLLTRTVRGLVAGRPVYLIPRGDGRVLLGASSREDDADHVSAGGIHDLLDDAIHLVPAVQEFGIEEILARPRPGTPDNVPILGATTPGVVLATGFYRHGVLLSPIAADVVAALVRRSAGDPRDGDADLLSLASCADPDRFAHPQSPPLERMPS